MVMGQGDGQMDWQIEHSRRKHWWIWMCQHEWMNAKWGARPLLGCLHVLRFKRIHINLCVLYFFLLLLFWECTTFDRLPETPSPRRIPHLISLYRGQLSARTWPKKKTHLSPSLNGRRVCVCVCVCREDSFHPVNPCRCSLLSSLAHFWGLWLL